MNSGKLMTMAKNECVFFFCHQGKHKTVGAAYRAAVLDLLQDAELNFHRSHYYWAGFILHGFADVALDDEFLKRIKSCFESK